MTQYEKVWPWLRYVQGPEKLEHILAQIFGELNYKNLRVAETEKYAHVTYFFNGGVEKPYPGEERLLVPSPKVATYDLKPEMSAAGITDAVVKAIDKGDFDAIIMNYANADMVGHSGKLEATIKAVETVDECLGRLYQSLKPKGGAWIITADHGNAETMIDPKTGGPHTYHTTNPVPFILATEDSTTRLTPNGSLRDIAPTLLGIISQPEPTEMTGRDLRATHAEMNRPSPAETKLVICVWHPFDLWRPPPSMAEAVRKHWPAMRVVHLPNYDRLEAELPDTQIFVGYSIRPHQLPWARQLKWIHSTAAGVAQLTYPALRESGILVTNASGVHSIPIAEHVIGMLLSLSRKFPDALRHQQNHRWAQQEIWDSKPRPGELHDAVLLLIGLGAVGKEIARRAQAFGMKIQAVTRFGPRRHLARRRKFIPPRELESALAQADYVVVAAPETPATHNLLGPRQFAAMKPHSVRGQRSPRLADRRSRPNRSPRKTQNRRRRARCSRRRTAAARKPPLAPR